MLWIAIAVLFCWIIIRRKRRPLLKEILSDIKYKILKKKSPFLYSLKSEGFSEKQLYGYSDTPYRVLDWGEDAMGAPSYFTIMLSDGAIIPKVDNTVISINHDELQVMLQRTNNTYGKVIVIYNKESYRLFYPNEKITRHEMVFEKIKENPDEYHNILAGYCESSSFIQLYSCLGLKINEKKHIPEFFEKTIDYGIKLRAELLLPTDLRSVKHPMLLLYAPIYLLFINNQDTGVYIKNNLNTPIISHSGKTLCFDAVQLKDGRFVSALFQLYWNNKWYALLSYATAPLEYQNRDIFSLYAESASDDGLFRFSLSIEEHETIPPALEIIVYKDNITSQIIIPVTNGEIILNIEKIPPTQ